MKWTRILALPVVLCSLFMVFLLSIPVIYPQMIHASPPLWMSGLRERLLPGGPIDTQPYAWILFGCMIAMYVLASAHVKLLNRPMTHGSSDYATRRMLRQFRAPRTPWLLRPLLWVVHAPSSLATTLQVLGAVPHNAQVRRFTPTTALFFVGIYHHRLIALREKQQEEHVLITGPTGSRKSILLIIRNLLHEALTRTRSVFIADLKNELFRITAGAMAQTHQVWRFAPTDPEHSHGYNPLAYVKDAMDANMLADCWVRNTGESKDDPFWATCARFLIASVILHLRATEPDAPFSRVAELITGKSFAQLKDILTQSPSHDARRKAENFLHNLSLNERLIGSVMTDIGGRFELFDAENMRVVTAINEVDFHQMVDTPTALYLSIPRSEVEFYRPLIACFSMQMFRTWEQRAVQEGTLPRSIACFLDEFSNIGYIPGYAQFVATARYLRVALIMVVQNFAQLDERYGREAAETIRANANTHLLLPGAGLRECTYYSERIGDTTVRTWSRSSRGSSWWGTDDTWTEGEAATAHPRRVTYHAGAHHANASVVTSCHVACRDTILRRSECSASCESALSSQSYAQAATGICSESATKYDATTTDNHCGRRSGWEAALFRRGVT
jgi:hypothetical protein